ncbi:mediator of RNA polymerase II transcription subunit 27 isoform X1 [Ascaphus truei]|uniref:mediator of RNA polymerase II transcription subunit 27 isoform X1 n=1 Tax=Ascaphus truei TaxID=8439 RepID=UPI003F594CCA
MADVMNVGVNLEAFSQAINSIQALRSSVTRVFDGLKDGMKNKETLEGREKAFVTEFQENLHSVNRDLNELERLSNLVGKPSENHPLHNSGLLSLDPVQDKTPLYSQLLQAYKWSNKLQYHAGLASGLLNQQSLKRSANQMGVSAKRRPKAQPTTLVLPPQYIDDVISRIDRMFPEMTIHLSRPNGTSAMLLVTLGKVLKVILVMRSLFIDRTIVKGYNENVYTEDGKLDTWSKSNYQVFQKVTFPLCRLKRLFGTSNHPPPFVPRPGQPTCAALQKRIQEEEVYIWLIKSTGLVRFQTAQGQVPGSAARNGKDKMTM